MMTLLWTILFLAVLVASACGFIELVSGHSGLPMWVFVFGELGLLVLGVAWCWLSPRLKGKFNRTLGILAILTASVFGLLMLAPFPSGGMGMRGYYLVNLGFLFLTIFWWKLAPLFEGRYNRVISYIAKGVVTCVLISYTLITSSAALGFFQGVYYKNKMSLENFKETFIEWPGFESPVGLHLEMDLVHPINMTGQFNKPFLWLGEFKKQFYWGIIEAGLQYYFGESSQSPYPATRHLQFMKSGSTKYMVNRLSKTTRRTHLVYDVYPRNLKYSEKSEKLCFHRDTTSPTNFEYLPVYYHGEDLSALWYFQGGGLKIDMSDRLTEALRKNSAYQGKSQEWKTMQKQLEFAELRANGYRECVVMQPKAVGSNNHKYPFKDPCYCKPSKKGLKKNK
jgi:hypothetical protein